MKELSLKRKEKITIDEYDNFLCICGNEPSTFGFYPCNKEGVYIDPCINEGWIDLYRCDNCNRIINQNSLEVIGKYKQGE